VPSGAVFGGLVGSARDQLQYLVVSSYGNYGNLWKLCVDVVFLSRISEHGARTYSRCACVLKLFSVFRQQVRWSFCEFTLNIRVFCGGSRYFWCKRGDRNSRKLERRNNIHVLDPVEVGRFSSRPWKLSGVVTFLFANFMEENWFWSNPCECQERLLGHSREKLLFYTKCSGELVKVVRRLYFRHG